MSENVRTLFGPSFWNIWTYKRSKWCYVFYSPIETINLSKTVIFIWFSASQTTAMTICDPRARYHQPKLSKLQLMQREQRKKNVRIVHQLIKKQEGQRRRDIFRARRWKRVERKSIKQFWQKVFHSGKKETVKAGTSDVRCSWNSSIGSSF